MPTVRLNNETIQENSFRRSGFNTRNRIEILSMRIDYDKDLPTSIIVSRKLDFYERDYNLEKHSVKWYSSKFQSELPDEIPHSILTLPHWHIRSGNPELFTVNGRMYDSIDMVYGEEKTYWRFIFSKVEIEEAITKVFVLWGETILDKGTCPCCMDHHYQGVVDCIKKDYMKKRKLRQRQNSNNTNNAQ